ncbi:DUF397 domain-containing protein [Streptosporangium sp. NBC_01755]|uniref:DUF397 domain-containing protein n=1 Tax=unclassified Streptosporangium TaxID=2632669 RepID=UPI002DDA32E7|nr:MULTISPECIES: DUF397 domain-containing protein [unclassified Streptosporangium]WSA23100.1 DUF397 domain-containing protein [Streptosporangium sp. NBC_01810]WSC98757.1 DUF397 domain-containing protein [Streptosporangium sp. NBC_01755]
MDLTGAEWRKSSRSSTNGGNCVEVASNLPGVIAVRDSKNPNGSALIFSRSEWGMFLKEIKEGGFEV